MRRLVLVVLAAVMMSGCELRWVGDELWACETATATDGRQFSGCQDTGIRRVVQ